MLQKNPQNWDANVDHVAISKLIETKNNSDYLIGYLDEVMRLSVLILSKMSEYVKIFKDEVGDKSKNLYMDIN